MDSRKQSFDSTASTGSPPSSRSPSASFSAPSVLSSLVPGIENKFFIDFGEQLMVLVKERVKSNRYFKASCWTPTCFNRHKITLTCLKKIKQAIEGADIPLLIEALLAAQETKHFIAHIRAITLSAYESSFSQDMQVILRERNSAAWEYAYMLLGSENAADIVVKNISLLQCLQLAKLACENKQEIELPTFKCE